MVSLRSGKRTNRLSTGAVTSAPTEPAEESTPKRPTRGRKAAAVQKVFDDAAPNFERESSSSSVEEIVPTPPTQSSPVKNVALSPEKADSQTPAKSDSFDSTSSELYHRKPSPDVFADSESDEVVEDSTENVCGGEVSAEEGNDVEMAEEPEVIALDEAEKTEELQEEEDAEVVEEDSDDDMPMEVSSKKEASKPEKEVSDSDEDEPMEVTSKVVPEVSQKSVVEQLLEKKANKAAKLAEKKLKKRSKNKKKESKKIDEGFYQVKMKKSKAKFNVVTLKSGVQKMLEPQVNFREQLLQARTAGTRVEDSKKFQQRAKWVAKRS